MSDRRIIPREEWGAVHERGAGPAPLPATETWLHHSVTTAPDLVPPFTDDYTAVRRLEQIGEQRFGRGISYTFVITPVGLIFEGHGIDRRGAHTLGHNVAGRAICFVGDYDRHRPSEAMIDSAGWLLAHGFLAGWWTAAELQGGHRDVRATSCPGRHAYAAMATIDGLAARYARQGTEQPTYNEDDDMNPIALVLLTYNAILDRNPESLEIIAQGAESIRQANDGGHAFVNAVANSEEAAMRHKAKSAEVAKVDRVRSDAEIIAVVTGALQNG